MFSHDLEGLTFSFMSVLKEENVFAVELQSFHRVLVLLWWGGPRRLELTFQWRRQNEHMQIICREKRKIISFLFFLSHIGKQ